MKTEEKNEEETIPTFVGVNAALAANEWTQNHLARKLIENIDIFSQRLIGRITNTRDALQIIKVAIDDYENIPDNHAVLSERDQLYDFLLEIPGINHTIAKRVIVKYNTFSALLNASVIDLKAIDRIGESLAKRIKEKVTWLLNNNLR